MRKRLPVVAVKHKLNSGDDFFYQENYLKINNTNLPADETAKVIAGKFWFPVL